MQPNSLTSASDHAPFDHAEHMAAMSLRQQIKVERKKASSCIKHSSVKVTSSCTALGIRKQPLCSIPALQRSKPNIPRELIMQVERAGPSHVRTTLTDGRPKRTNASGHYDQTPREYLPQGSSLSQMPSSTTSTIQAQQNNLTARRAKLRQSLRRLKMLLHVKGSDEETLKAAISMLDIKFRMFPDFWK